MHHSNRLALPADKTERLTHGEMVLRVLEGANCAGRNFILTAQHSDCDQMGPESKEPI